MSGREARGGGGAGDLIPSGVGAGEGVGRERAPVPTRSGEQGRGRGRRGGLGRGRGCGGAAQFGPGGFGADGPRVQWGGRPAPFFSFSVLFCFLFSFYLFISFSVLFHLKVFRYFIKMCFLHHNYQCII